MSSATVEKGQTRVAFGDVVRLVRDKVDPEDSGVERYVAGEHMDTDELRIRGWGVIGDGYLGPAFHMRFKPGHVLYGSRRTYLRKVALADFEGICANTTFVLESKDPKVLLPELLPFVMQTEAFHTHSISQSKGSVNPYVNFSDLAWFEFALPPLEEQRRIAEGIQAVEDCKASLRRAAAASQGAFESLCMHQVTDEGRYSGLHPTNWAPEEWALRPLEEVVAPDAPICYGIVQVRSDDPNGIPTLAINNLGGCYRDGVHRTAKGIEEKYQRSRVAPGDVIISIKGTIGEIDILPPHFTGNISRDIARIRLNPEILRPRFFLYLYLSLPYRRYMQSLVVGSTRAELSIAAIRKMAVPYPALDEQDRIAHELGAMAKATEKFEKRVSNLVDFQKRLRERALAA